DPALLDAIMNDMGSSWCEGVTDYNGDRGTPGQANTPCSSPDAGSAMDAGSDAGSMMDAGSSADAGSTMDAGLDAGSTMDSGVDAGSTTDAGVDAGSAMDAGSSADAGSAMDAGSGADGGTGPVPPDTAGQVVITEIMNNPTTVADAMGEWFELYNPSASVTYELDGCEIKDDGTDTHVVLGPLQIGPGEYLAMANSMMPGFTPGYIYDGSMFTLDNGTDEVVFKCSGEFIDRVAYDSGATYPNVAGRSMNLSPLRLDAFENNVGANWCVASEVYNGDFGTPGTANSPCP
ncbi:MAG: lamin tail domain-containing protein, partial [Myxococcota bacterium]